MFLCCIYFAVLLFGKEAQLKLISPSEDQGKLRHSLTQCVLSAAREFESGDIITMALATKEFTNYTNSNMPTDTLLMQALYKKMNWTILVTKPKKQIGRQSRFFKKSDNYIIQIRDRDEFALILSYLKQRISWNPHAKFIVITTTVFENPTPVVATVVESLWRERVINVIILLPQEKYSSKIVVYSWVPFSNKRCDNGYEDIDVINICRYGAFMNSSLLFPNKIPENMNGCPVKIRTVIWPPFIIRPEKINNLSNVNFTEGIEILLMNTVAQVANFTLIYSISKKAQDWGHISRNKSATGMMKTVLNEEVDIGLGALAALKYRHYHFDTSVTYLQEALTWCVPHALPEPKWKCLLIIFHFSTWILIIFSYFLVSLGIKFLTIYSNESLSYKSAVNIFQNVFSIALGITVKQLPKLSRIRILIILWTGVCLTLTAAYQSALISFLTKPNFEKQIETFDQMVDMGYTFGLVPQTFRFIRNHKNSSKYQLNHWIDCDDIKMCLNRVAHQRDFAVGVPRMYMVYSSNTYINKRGENLLYWSKDNIVSYPIEMVMVRGYPMLKRINQIISRIKEAGLISKWMDQFLENYEKIDKFDDDEDDDVILTEKHFEGSFIALAIGLSLASIVLVFEILYYRKNMR